MKPNQSVDVGFQCRNAPPIAALAEKIKAGALGKIATASGNYNAPASTEKKREGEGPDEYRLRNWLWDRALSGDILVEQNIHIIDLCNWMLGAHPLKATATGGRNVLTHFGDCWDNYQVDFTYPERRALLVRIHAVRIGWCFRRRVEVVRRQRIGDLSRTPGRLPSPAQMRGRGRIRNRPRPARASSPPMARSSTTSNSRIATRSARSSPASSPGPRITRSPTA